MTFAAENREWRGQVLAGLARAAVFAAVVIPLWIGCGWTLWSLGWEDEPLLVSVFSLFPAALLANGICLLWERRRMEEVGAGWSARSRREAVWGVALGAGLCAALLGIQALAGWLRWEQGSTGASWEPPLLWGVVVLAAGAAGEELLFRGYGLQQLMRAVGIWPAVLATSLLFGVLHAGNPEASRIAVANTVLFGLLFGFALVRRRTLWLPFGMHWGWNMTLALLGVNVSGIRMKLTAWDLTAAGPDLWTGGEYGPEASLLTTLAVVAAGWMVWRIPAIDTSGRRIWEWRSEAPAEEADREIESAGSESFIESAGGGSGPGGFEEADARRRDEARAGADGGVRHGEGAPPTVEGSS